MLSKIKFIFALLPVLIGMSPAMAQQGAAGVAGELRAQLAEVQAKQAELKMRLEELNEALKPENIQNNLAGVGSVHPEDLREQRRRQLEKEKAGVVSQLEQLTTSQRRLEKAIGDADAAAYHQSAAPEVSNIVPTPAVTEKPSKKKTNSHRKRARRAKSKTPSQP